LYFIGRSGFTGSIDNVSVKKVKEYEDNWYDVSSFLISDSVSPISEQIPDNLYEFGEIKLSNANLKVQNPHGEFSDETNLNSIFKNYIRHNSLIRVIEGYVDRYTDPENPEQIDSITFEGFIDDKTAKTDKKTNETFSAKGLISVLSTLTKSELGTLTSTNVNDLVYEIMDRGQFTQFFEVNTNNIDAGYNTTNLNLSLIPDDKKVIDILKDLAYGHSVFYVKNGAFYFRPAKPTSVIKHLFLASPDKKLDVYDFNQGSKKVIEKWFWEDTSLSYISDNEKFGTSKNINIDAVDNTTQRQNLLNYIGSQTDTPKLTFKFDIPFYPTAQIFDLVQIRRTEILDSKGGFILDESRLDEGILGQVIGAIKISSKQYFYIIGINHAANRKTTLTVQEVNYMDIPAIESDVSDMIAGYSPHLLNDEYSSNCVNFRRNNNTDTAVDAGANDERDFIFRRKFLDTYILGKWLNPNDFVDNAGENGSSDTAYLKTFYDQSGNAYDIAQATTSRQPKYNQSGKSFTFDKTNTMLARTALSEIDVTKPFSVFIVCTPSSVTGSQMIVGNYININNRFGFVLNGSNLSAETYDGSRHTKSGSITASRFSAVAIYDGNGNMSLYINGVEQTGSTIAFYSGASFVIGGKSDFTNIFGGEIETVAVFGKILNAKEIETLTLFGEQTNG